MQLRVTVRASPNCCAVSRVRRMSPPRETDLAQVWTAPSIGQMAKQRARRMRPMMRNKLGLGRAATVPSWRVAGGASGGADEDGVGVGLVIHE